MAKILYIEDNETNRDMLSRRLELEGHEVLLAEDGPSGLLRARQDRPDLILLDMSLPGMDGWELAAQLRAEAGARRVPLVALTAHAMPGDRERCLAAGCDDYDTKPVDVARLLAKIEAHLGRAAHPTPLSPAPPEPAEPEIARPTLLLVEDDDLSRDFLSRRIGMEGYVVETAADGPAALARLEERDFDLVLLDVMLPGLSGLSVLEALRGRWNMVERPVIMVTARDRSQDIVEALRLGANDYVGKPVDIAVLLARITAQLRIAGLERALRAEKDFSENLIRNARLMIIAWDEAGRITRFNRAAEAAFGCSAQDRLGGPVEPLFAEAEAARILLHGAACPEGFSGEIAGRRNSGETFPLSHRLSASR